MLKRIYLLLPVFLYVRLARRCEAFNIGGSRWHQPADEILVRAEVRKL